MVEISIEFSVVCPAVTASLEGLAAGLLKSRSRRGPSPRGGIGTRDVSFRLCARGRVYWRDAAEWPCRLFRWRGVRGRRKYRCSARRGTRDPKYQCGLMTDILLK